MKSRRTLRRLSMGFSPLGRSSASGSGPTSWPRRRSPSPPARRQAPPRRARARRRAPRSPATRRPRRCRRRSTAAAPPRRSSTSSCSSTRTSRSTTTSAPTRTRRTPTAPSSPPSGAPRPSTACTRKITKSGPVGPLLTSNPNEYNPQRLTNSEALTSDQNHGYTAGGEGRRRRQDGPVRAEHRVRHAVRGLRPRVLPARHRHGLLRRQHRHRRCGTTRRTTR